MSLPVVSSTMSASAVSEDYLKDILRMIVYYKPSGADSSKFYNLLRRLRKDFDLLVPPNSVEELTRFRHLLLKAIKLRLEGRPPSAIEDTLLPEAPWLKQKVGINYPALLQDLIAKYKYYLTLKNIRQLSVELYEKGKEGIDKISDAITSTIHELYRTITELESSGSEVSYKPEEIEKRIEERIEELSKADELRKFVPSSISLLNYIFSNQTGYEKGCVYMFGAPTGAGKTRFVIVEGGFAFLSGYSVLHITIENPEKKVADLYDSTILGIPTTKLYQLYKSVGKGDLEAQKQVEEIVKNLRKAVEERSNAQLKIKKFHPLQVTPLMIENYLEQLIEEGFKPDVLIIDHIDLLLPNSGERKDLFRAGEELVAEIKTIAERFDVVALIPTQVNREGNIQSKRTKKNSSIFEEVLHRGVISRSAAKIEYVDFFATLNINSEEKDENLLRIYIDKNRDGISDLIIPCYFDREALLLYPLDNFSSLPVQYKDVSKILRSLAVIHYQAFQNPTLRTQVVEKVKEFATFLPLRAQEVLREELKVQVDTCRGEEISPSRFLQILKEGDYEFRDLEVKGIYLNLDLIDKETGEVKGYCISIPKIESTISEYLEEFGEDSFEVSILSGLLEQVY